LQGVTCQRQICGGFTVYTDFQENLPWIEEEIPVARVRAMASHNSGQAHTMSDGNRWQGWDSSAVQTNDMQTEFQWPDPLPLTRISLFYQDFRVESAVALNISLHTSEGWKTLTNNVPSILNRFEIFRSHPEYGQHSQTIRFSPTLADGVRLEIASVRPNRNWTIREAEFYLAVTNRFRAY
jgi:hypothetical protein